MTSLPSHTQARPPPTRKSLWRRIAQANPSLPQSVRDVCVVRPFPTCLQFSSTRGSAPHPPFHEDFTSQANRPTPPHTAQFRPQCPQEDCSDTLRILLLGLFSTMSLHPTTALHAQHTKPTPELTSNMGTTFKPPLLSSFGQSHEA